MTLPAFLDHLRARGYTVVTTKRGAKATCPGHDDTRPSLDVTEGRAHRVLLYCRAGCRTTDILAAVDLRLSDLFANALDAPIRARPRTALDAMRAEARALAKRQAWAQPGMLERYGGADTIRAADRVRRAAREDDPDVWEKLADAARATTLAENILAGGEDA
jgi:hypothetical protein